VITTRRHPTTPLITGIKGEAARLNKKMTIM
jgi:hypothetical protein